MECWECHQNFPSNRDLKNHMGPTHGTMKVVCPWCPEERTYKRVTDLRSHAKQAHSSQLAKYPTDLISESNGVWFSFNPEGYCRLVRGSDWGSSVATHARVLVLEWLSKTRHASKKKDQWVRGWNSMKTQVPSFAPTPEALFKPDYEETMTTTTPSQYSPEEPLIADLEVEHVNLASRKITLKQGAQLFVLTLIATVLGDAKAMASISRKIAVQNKAEEPKTYRRRPITLNTIRRRLTRFIGIDEKFIEAIEEHQQEQINLPVKRKRESEPSPVPSSSTSFIESAQLPSSSSKETKHYSETPLKPSTSERALNLLKRGCLPLFPPARRDWGTDQIALQYKDLTILWPPKDWQEMSPDRKLLSWEFMAMTIQQRMDQSQCMKIERMDLLDKFNFLALPGTIEKIGKKESQVIRKSRYYIYEQLKTIVSENEGDDIWLKMLEKSCALRDRTTDDLLATIDGKNIPVRL